MRRTIATSVILAALVALPVLAQSDDDRQTTGSAANAEVRTPGHVDGERDLKFVKEAAMSDLLELRLGEMAVKQAQSADVRKYGQRLVDDHSKTHEDLSSLASQKNVALPEVLDETRQKKVDKLLKLSGREFDHEFIEVAVKNHDDDIEMYQKEARDGKDADVKGFAQHRLVDLNDHLKQAKQVKKVIGE